MSAALRFELRPVVRGDCADGARPCPHVACKYHLLREWPLVGRGALAASPDWADGWRTHPATRGAASLAEALDRMPATCALDVIDAAPDGLPLEEIGRLLGCTRERARQIEARALRKLAMVAAARRLRNG
jgi:DNA-directed RNA polymerase specialized sigma24 family protein